MAPLIVLVTATLLLRLVGQVAIVGLREWAVAGAVISTAIVIPITSVERLRAKGLLVCPFISFPFMANGLP